MKIAYINAVPYGSTGRIVSQLNDFCKTQGDETIVFFSWAKKKHRKHAKEIHNGLMISRIAHMILAKITGRMGCFSYLETLHVVHSLKKFNPDIVHLNILHAWSFNLSVIFSFLKKNQIPVVWTMHDCWAVTGHCAHFSIAKCDKWKTGCYNCSQYKDYPAAYVDSSEYMWKKKKEIFTSLNNLYIVTPSKWMEGVIKQSFLKGYETKVINNGVDLSVFKPTESNFRRDYGLENKKIVLGVSFDWGYKKGLDIFLSLSKELDEAYKIVLVGVEPEKKYVIPDGIIAIEKTNSQAELAMIYSSADVFVNPTREEVLGLVNIEALSCGLPVITFNSGGSPECIDSSCGIVINEEKISDIVAAIKLVCNDDRTYTKANCIERAKMFSSERIYEEYYDLYKEVRKCKK